MHNFKEIQENIKRTETALLEKFPNCHYTTTLLLWDDGTYRVQTRHGDGTYLHDMVWYEGEITYVCNHMKSPTMYTDENGNEFPCVIEYR